MSEETEQGESKDSMVDIELDEGKIGTEDNESELLEGIMKSDRQGEYRFVRLKVYCSTAA
jgi:hypothetical protein